MIYVLMAFKFTLERKFLLISFAAAGAKLTCSASNTCNARSNLLFLKNFHCKHENNLTRINKVV